MLVFFFLILLNASKEKWMEFEMDGRKLVLEAKAKLKKEKRQTLKSKRRRKKRKTK